MTQVVRKLIRLGNSRAITLPKSWLDHAEKESGRKITHAKITIDHALTIQPIFAPVNSPSVLRACYSLALDTVQDRGDNL